MTFTKIAVGSDVVYHCSRCSLDLGHTVVAMVGNQPARVRCNTCKSERNFRQKKTVDAILKSFAPRPKIIRPDLYQEKIQANLMKNTKPYRTDASFELDDVIEHKVFGKGVVIKVVFPDRVEVLFKDQSRVLMCRLETKVDDKK